MINFYCLEDNLYQVCIRDLSIYYSFKMPIAYRIKKDLRVRKGLLSPMHINIVTTGQYYVTTDAEVFDFNLKHIFKATIYNLAEDFTKERFSIPQEEKNKPIHIGDMPWDNIGKL